ncbi:MAG TPA: FtsX-like permease family protein, partial [Deinococcales bacterium]|nr:FtsX-like permease family protein [Deinococcales bacterium]
MSNFGRVGAVTIEALQEEWRLGGRASMIEVVLSGERTAARVQEELQEQLGAEYAVVPPQVVGDVATGLVDALGAGLQVLALTLLVLAAFLAYNTFAAGVVERVREYALLRTICLTGRQLGRLALLEALFLSLAGVVAGLLLGVVLARVLTRFNAAMLGVNVSELVIPALPVAVAVLTGIGVSLLAGWLPAREAARVPPLTALSSARPVPSPLPAALGWVLIAVGVVTAVWPWRGTISLVMAGVAALSLFTGVTVAAGTIFRPALRLLTPLLERLFGVPGRLGSSMALRNVNRNGVALGIVMVGLSLTIGVGSMTAGVNRTVSDWVDTTVLGDLFLTGPVGFPDDFAEQVREAIPETDVVSGVAFNAVRFQPEDGRARTVALILVEPERFEPGSGIGSFQFYRGQGDPESAWETLRNDGVLIASSIQERFRLGPGSDLNLRTSEGFRDFPVGGVIVDFTSGGEAVVAGRQLQPLFGGGSPDLYVITVRDGADPGVVAERLPELFPDLYLDVTMNRDYREYIMGEASDVFATTNLLLVLALFIAGLGVGNTLGLNLAGRQHEFAVLRTLGLTRAGL